MSEFNKVLIYRDHLLPISETFITSQGNGLKRYRSHFVGSRRVSPSLDIESSRALVINTNNHIGYFSEYLFKKFGFFPTKFEKKLMDINPSLIHAHFGVDGALALPIKEKLKIPMITTFHGFDITVRDEFAKNSYFGHRIYLKKRDELFQTCNHFIAVSDFIKTRLVEKGMDQQKITTHFIGIDVSLFNPDPSIERNQNILFVGRLVEKKGCQFLLESMRNVKKYFPNVTLTVIGDGPLKSSLEEYAAQHVKNVSFLGSQPHGTVKEWMNKSSIFCVPSITAKNGDSEAFGLVFAEAQAMELPVVSHVHGGIPEAVINEETGLLSEEKDIDSLSENIIKLLDAPDRALNMGKKGRTHILEKFDLDIQTQKLENLYDHILAK